MKITKIVKQSPDPGDLCVTNKRCIFGLISDIGPATQYIEPETLVLVVGAYRVAKSSYVMFDGEIGWLFNSEMSIVQEAKSFKETK